MTTLKGSQRTYLRGIAHKLKPVVQVGKNGITNELITAANQVLEAHELIKIKFIAFKEEKKKLTRQIEDLTKSEMVGLIGNIAIFYKQNPKKEKRKIKIP